MSLSRRALKEDSRVLIIDDFKRVGGTMRGMIDLLKEFNATVKGIGVFVESAEVEEHLVEDYVSLVKISGVDSRSAQLTVVPGNYFEESEEL